MSIALFAGIDWTRPWLVPFRDLAAPIIQTADWCDVLNEKAGIQGLKNHRGLPIRFVPQSSLPVGMAYEEFISATGCVPTRENLHDFFNALVWLTFPRIKVQLNALQAAEIEKGAGPSCRGKVRDACTIFDENAAILLATDDAWIQALRDHRWSDVFFMRRDLFKENCEVRLFGHALMEKLITPYKAITAHVWPIVSDPSVLNLPNDEKLAWLDAEISRQLMNGLVTTDFTPLPVLGVPNWCDGQTENFYADALVFRPKRYQPVRTA